MGISPEKKKDFKAQLIDFLLFFFFLMHMKANYLRN